MTMWSDEIVEEVRAIRNDHAARFQYDLRAIYADLKQSESARIAAGHPYIEAPPESTEITDHPPLRFAPGPRQIEPA
jgi:hypothetical protein